MSGECEAGSVGFGVKPLVIDLYCGLGGWAEGFLAEGYDVIGFDIERHDYGTGGYPGQLVLQDVLTLHGSQFKDAAVIVASPPCQEPSKYAMPFGGLWREHNRMDDDGGPPIDYQGKSVLNYFRPLFEACFRIQREAIEATKYPCKHCNATGAFPNGNKCYCCGGKGTRGGRYVPLIVENVRGAERWVGGASWRYGPFFLWGDVPALMPIGRHRKQEGDPSWFYDNYENGARRFSSHSRRRKEWSAQIAKIPFPLANHIARVFKP